MGIEKNLNVNKTKPVAPRGHPLLLLLFFRNKSCMHDEVRTCMEVLPKNYSDDSNDSTFKIEELSTTKGKGKPFLADSALPQTATKHHLIANWIPEQRAM